MNYKLRNITLMLMLAALSCNKNTNRMISNGKFQKTTEQIDFVVNEDDLNSCLAYQIKKYQLKDYEQISIDKELQKWNRVNSIENEIYCYLPPKPGVAARMQIYNGAKITYFQDGLYAQIIREIIKVDERTYKFKLCHNHDSPFDDGLIPAQLTILNEKKGIAVWEEWRKKEEPIITYLVRNDLADKVNHITNNNGVLGNFEYSFDNKLLNKMKNNR